MHALKLKLTIYGIYQHNDKQHKIKAKNVTEHII